MMPSEGMRGCKVPLMAEDKGICGDNYVKQEQPQYPPPSPDLHVPTGTYSCYECHLHRVSIPLCFYERSFPLPWPPRLGKSGSFPDCLPDTKNWSN